MSEKKGNMPEKIIIESAVEDEESNHDEISLSQELLDQSEVQNIQIEDGIEHKSEESNKELSNKTKHSKDSPKTERYLIFFF